MALFSAVIRKDSFSFLRFPFLSHVQVFFSWKIPFVCRKKCPYYRFSIYCWSVHPCFVCVVSGRCNQVFRCPFWNSLRDVLSMYRRYSQWWPSPLTPFLDTYSLSTTYLECKALCIVMNFLILWSICFSSLVHF